MQNIRLLTAALALFAGIGVHAQPSSSAAQQVSPPSANAATPNTEGVVRKVDQEQGKLTIKHGPIPNLDMPAMTMVFKVSDPKALATLKEGDKVRFFADKVSGAPTIMSIEVIR